MLSKYGIYIAFCLLVVAMAIISPAFLHPSNIVNILRQIAVNGIMAVGMTFVMITGGIDLSIGSILALAAVVAASFAHPGEHRVIISVMMALAVGLGVGFINGFIIAKKRLAPFIVTLGMMTVARGMALVYTNGRPVINLSDGYNRIGGGYFIGLPIPVLAFLLIILGGIFLLHFTRFGRYVYAIGGNELAAKVSGVNTQGMIIRVYALSGMLAALAGVVLSSRVMSGSPSMGQGYELDVIAAVVIGGTTLSGGVGSIGGTIIGALIIGVMNNGLDLLNVSSYWQEIVKGVIIVLAVMLDRKTNR
jgi:ribose/xylose/arabinose/galactoside ABC-type transport system permease subunit